MLLNIALNSKDNLYNISSNDDISILELAKNIAKITKSKIILPQNDKNISGTQTSTSISSKKYFDEFGNFKKVSLKDGIKLNIKWLEYLKAMI